MDIYLTLKIPNHHNSQFKSQQCLLIFTVFKYYRIIAMDLPIRLIRDLVPGPIDLDRVRYVVKYAVHLHQHNVSSDIHEEIHQGLEYCKEYLNDPAGAHDKTFAMMIRFVRKYLRNRIEFCNSCLNTNFIVSIVDATYQIAKMQSVPLKNFPLAIKDLDDYGDCSRFVAQGLRCQHCYGYLYFNQVNPKTGVQFQWFEIAQALKQNQKSKSLLPTHLWERLAPVDEDTTNAEVYSNDILLVDSFLEAARATGAQEAAMVWQVVRHADREADTVKDLIMSEDWVGLATHTHNARVLLDAMLRGPIYLSSHHQEAVYKMTIAVSLVQYTWFRVITRSTSQEGGISFERSDHETSYYPGPLLWEKGMSPYVKFAPKKFPFGLLRDWSNINIFAVDKMVTNGSDERWIGDISMFDNSLVSSYSLPPNETITSRRVKHIHLIMTLGRRWNLLKNDSGVTSLMALRFPTMYSDRFLQDIVRIGETPDSRLMISNGIVRLPGRGLVSLVHLDGLFDAETIFHLEDHQDRAQIAVQRIRQSQYEGLEDYLDGGHVDESLILWENPGAATILKAMNLFRVLTDRFQMPDFQNDVAWTDLSIGLRRATHPTTATIYTMDRCQKLVKLAGLSKDRLIENGWSRHDRAGIVPLNFLPTNVVFIK